MMMVPHLILFVCLFAVLTCFNVSRFVFDCFICFWIYVQILLICFRIVFVFLLPVFVGPLELLSFVDCVRFVLTG